MYSLTHLDNETLLEGFQKMVARDRLVTAVLLAHIAEIDHRHLYLQEGFESMKAYCMKKLQLTEDAAAKRIQVARLARQFPILFPAIADGSLSILGARMLAPRLTGENVRDLVKESAHLTAPEIELLLAKRFPLTRGAPFQASRSTQIVAAQEPDSNSHAARHVSFVRHVVRARIKPITGDQFLMHFSVPGETRDRLRYAQKLLAHAVPTGNVPEVFDRALRALISQEERRKFGVGSRRSKANVRGIPARVRHAVFERDQGRCTIRLPDGRRCQSQDRIEFDHIVPVAKGGRSTTDNLRLVCRAHNLWAAEQEFGRVFMAKKRNPK